MKTRALEILEKATTAHINGKLREAEALYISALETEPTNVDANHNLAVIYLSRNDAAKAIPFLKRALEEKPSIMQFWVTYLDALLQVNDTDMAEDAIKQARAANLPDEILKSLEFQRDRVVAREPPIVNEIQNLATLLAAEEYQALVKFAEESLELAPLHPLPWKYLGVALAKLGLFDEALKATKKAAALKPLDSEIHKNLSRTYQSLGQNRNAIKSMQKAIKLQPNNSELHYMLSVLFDEAGNDGDAEISYKKAINLNPKSKVAHHNLGALFMRQGKFLEAEEYLKKAIDIDPRFTTALINIANLYQKHGYTAYAKEYYLKALEFEPNLPNVLNNLGNIFRKEQAFADAEKYLRRALALDKNHVEALSNLGAVLLETQRQSEAQQILIDAIRVAPNFALAHNNLGNAYKDLGNPQAAEESYITAIKLDPNLSVAHTNYGILMSEMSRYQIAVNSFTRAINLDKDNWDAYWNKSLISLLLGDFETGWSLYEARWKIQNKTSPSRLFKSSLWLGKESLVGKTVYLFWEQGFGDTIQFIRYAQLVKNLGAKVILEVRKQMYELCRRLPGVDQLVVYGSEIPPHDYHCPLMSLPLAMGTRLSNIPASDRYIEGSKERKQVWSDKLGKTDNPRLGIVWQGNPAHKNDKNRSITLDDLAEAIPNCYDVISLQKDCSESDLKTLDDRKNIKHVGDEIRDFADTAALCDLMTCIVSVDTSVAHLAGAMGKPTKILIPANPDWRWLLDRSDSPWYPSVELVRQQDPLCWSDALQALSKRLSVEPE